jgi:DnaJ like chaperone protein
VAMQWLGKAIGATLGFAVAGPFGSLLGAIVGHQFDQGALHQFVRADGAPSAPEHIRRLFFEVTFEVMGRLAKADGRVSEEEIRIARRIMHAMQLSPEQVQSAIERFTLGKRAEYRLSERLEELKRRFGGRRDLGRAFVEIQVQAAVGGGEIAQPKRQLLWQVAHGIGIGRVELAQIEALVRAQASQRAPGRRQALDLGDAYRVLGVEPSASDQDIKIAYRRLMNQHHPDKLVSRGLPEAMMTLAEQKTHEIRAAYDRIKAERALK